MFRSNAPSRSHGTARATSHLAAAVPGRSGQPVTGATPRSKPLGWSLKPLTFARLLLVVDETHGASSTMICGAFR